MRDVVALKGAYMKQTVLKKKTFAQVLRNRPAELSVPMSPTPAHETEEALLEKSPWLAEIQNALSPYWSARLAR
jgi:hypothetical protein